MDFKLVSNYQPRGDQAQAIEALVRGLRDTGKHQVLLGVTGSGKTYTMAKVIEQVGRPTLVLAHNKTLAAQLFHEFRGFFPHSAVEYFVSYYDYYQPEAYLPATDLYIEKEATINDELDKLRMAATRALFERRDAVIVASVSCIYGLGSPEAYYGMLLLVERGQRFPRQELVRKLVEIQYERSEELGRGTFRVRGDQVEVFPPYVDVAYRVELWGDQVDRINEIDPLTGAVLQDHARLPAYPKTHFFMPRDPRDRAPPSIPASPFIRKLILSCPATSATAPWGASWRSSRRGSRSSKSKGRSSKPSASSSPPSSTPISCAPSARSPAARPPRGS